MKRYENSTPRAAIGIAAVAMTVFTLSLMVVAPSRMEQGAPETTTLASTKTIKSEATEVAISPARIEVLGLRDPEVASAAPRQPATKSRQHG